MTAVPPSASPLANAPVGAHISRFVTNEVLRRQLSTGDAAVVDVLGSADGVSEPILGVYLYLANNPMNLESGPLEDMQFRPITEPHAVHTLTQAGSERRGPTDPSPVLRSKSVLAR